MELVDVCRRTAAGVEVDLLVSPRSPRTGVEGIDPWRKRLVVKVKAPPLDGRANREVEELLSRITGCRAFVVSGQTSRQKTVAVEGDPEWIWADIQKTL